MVLASSGITARTVSLATITSVCVCPDRKASLATSLAESMKGLPRLYGGKPCPSRCAAVDIVVGFRVPPDPGTAARGGRGPQCYSPPSSALLGLRVLTTRAVTPLSSGMHLNLRGVCDTMFMVRATNALRLLVQSLLIGAALIYGQGSAFPQTTQKPPPDRVGGAPTQDQEATAKPQTPQTTPAPVPTPADQTPDNSEGKQTKRMLWLVPNFAAVDANKQLPPMSTREKFVLAAKDSVLDYSSYTWAGILAG